MLATERAHLPDDQVDAVLQRARYSYARPEHGVRIWLEYAGQVCRRVAAKSEGKCAAAMLPIADRVMYLQGSSLTGGHCWQHSKAALKACAPCFRMSGTQVAFIDVLMLITLTQRPAMMLWSVLVLLVLNKRCICCIWVYGSVGTRRFAALI